MLNLPGRSCQSTGLTSAAPASHLGTSHCLAQAWKDSRVRQEAADYQSLLSMLEDLGDPLLVEVASGSQEQPEQQLVLLRVDHLGAVYGRPEDLAAAEGSLQQPGRAQVPPVLSHSIPAGPPPVDELAAAHGLTHMRPVWLRGSHWELTTAEVTCVVRRGPDQQVLTELEDLCTGIGATGGSEVGLPCVVRMDLCCMGIHAGFSTRLARQEIPVRCWCCVPRVLPT